MLKKTPFHIPKMLKKTPFHIPKMLKKTPFHIPKMLKKTPFWATPPVIGYMQVFPPGYRPQDQQLLDVRVHYFSQSENVYHNNLQGMNIVKRKYCLKWSLIQTFYNYFVLNDLR